MKVLIVNTLYYPYKVGGAEISVQSIAEGLKKKGVQVAVLTLGEETEKTTINDVLVYRLKIENLFWPFKNQEASKIKKLWWHNNDVYNSRYDRSINNIIQEFCPNIIHTNNLTGFSVAVWSLAKKKRIKVIHTLRDYYLQCPKTNRFKNNSCNKQCLECRFFSRKKKVISQSVDSVVGISHAILDSHINDGYFKSSYKKVIYNGFDFKKKGLIKTNFNKNTYLNFGFIGQVNKSKGIEFLMKELNAFKNYDNWKLSIAGSVDIAYKNYLLNFLPESKVEFKGYVKADTFFDTINVLIVPSLWEEPFGRVVLEGILSNIPVLGSNRGGIKEILSDNSKFIFDPDKDDLKNLIKRILESPEILNSFSFDINRFNDLFSSENTISGYIEMYKKLEEESFSK